MLCNTMYSGISLQVILCNTVESLQVMRFVIKWNLSLGDALLYSGISLGDAFLYSRTSLQMMLHYKVESL